MTPEQTIDYMLSKAQRKAGTPIRRTFVQAGTRHDPKPGPLAEFVTHRDQTALELYILALTLASASPYKVIYAAGWWARAIGANDDTIISRAWKRLEDRRLVVRSREGRIVVVTMLRDDGSGQPYQRPALKGEAYGKLPTEYWRQGFYRDLSLAAKAMLIVSITQPGSFSLPAERAKLWYGISADTVEKGIAELRKQKVLTRRVDWRLDRRVPSGYARSNLYTLLPPFGSAKAGLRVVS
jgi:hypothetical protein